MDRALACDPPRRASTPTPMSMIFDMFYIVIASRYFCPSHNNAAHHLCYLGSCRSILARVLLVLSLLNNNEVDSQDVIGTAMRCTVPTT